MADPSLHPAAVFPLDAADEERLAAADRALHPDDFEQVPAELWIEYAEQYAEHWAHSDRLRAPAMVVLECVIARGAEPPVAAAAWRAAGAIRAHWREFERAEVCQRRALATDGALPGTRSAARCGLARCLVALGRPDEALAELRAAVAEDPSSRHVRLSLGQVLEGEGRIDEAARAYADLYRVTAEAARRNSRPLGPDGSQVGAGDPRALRRLRLLLARHPELRDGDRGWFDGIPVDAHAVSADTARAVERLLASIRIEAPIADGNLQVFGLRWEAGPATDYRTLDEALAGGDFRVTEVSEQGRVPTLRVVNDSDGRVLLVSGEQLVGEKQNRVLNVTILVDRKTQTAIPVSCVEQGRWQRTSRGFSSSGTFSHGKLRRAMSKQVAASYAMRGAPASDQGAVWSEVGRKLESLGTVSSSGALLAAYELEAPRLDETATRLTLDPGWQGVLFAYGGRVAGMDLFDRPGTLGKVWPKLVRSYAIDALEEKAAVTMTMDQATAWLGGLARVAMEDFASPGLGRDVRFESADVAGGILLVDGRPLHLEAYPQDEDEESFA